MPVVPLLAAGLVMRLDRVIVEVVKVLEAVRVAGLARSPNDRDAFEPLERLGDRGIVVLSEKLQRQRPGGGGLRLGAMARLIAVAAGGVGTAADVVDGFFNRLRG